MLARFLPLKNGASSIELAGLGPLMSQHTEAEGHRPHGQEAREKEEAPRFHILFQVNDPKDFLLGLAS